MARQNIIEKIEKRELIKMQRSVDLDLKLRQLGKMITKAWKIKRTASELIKRGRR
jgi:hypothetical protein